MICFTVLPIDFPGINDTVVNLNFSLKPILSAFFSRAGLINFAPVPILELAAQMKVFDKWRSAGIFSIIVSVLIELVQYFETVNGYSDLVVVDIVYIITNTIGGLTGGDIQILSKNHI